MGRVRFLLHRISPDAPKAGENTSYECDLWHRLRNGAELNNSANDDPQRGAKFMRMPIFGYFVVVGAILFGAIVLVSSELEFKPLPVSQTVGVPAPFKVR